MALSSVIQNGFLILSAILLYLTVDVNGQSNQVITDADLETVPKLSANVPLMAAQKLVKNEQKFKDYDSATKDRKVPLSASELANMSWDEKNDYFVRQFNFGDDDPLYQQVFDVEFCMNNPLLRYYKKCSEIDIYKFDNYTMGQKAYYVRIFRDIEKKIEDEYAGLDIRYESPNYVAGVYRNKRIKYLQDRELPAIVHNLQRISGMYKDLIYYLALADTDWKLLRGNFQNLRALNIQALAAEDNKTSDYFNLTFAIANIPLTVINLLLHFIVRRQFNKYSI